jgi:hypothetical protein
MEILTAVQIAVLDKMVMGKEYFAHDLKAYPKTLGALVRHGYAKTDNRYVSIKKIKDHKRKL